MDKDVVEELLKIVVESLQSEEGNLNKAVDLSINFSTKNSISFDQLLNLSTFYGSKRSYELVYIFAKTAASLSTGSAKAVAHYNAGIASSFLNLPMEVEEQYKLAIEADPKHTNAHYNYGNLLSDMGRLEQAGEQYKLAIEADPKHTNAHYNYGIFLSDMGRLEQAEEQYKLAIEADPKHVSAHSNYGILLSDMGRLEQAEKQYKLAIEADPKHINAHYNYGILLSDMGRLEQAEEQFRTAIELNPKDPDRYGAYGLLLFFRNLEKNAIKETEAASRLYRENGDKVKEHLSLAWLYEEFANKYYKLKEYKKSGEYAEISGDEYIEAGKQAGESFKDTSLTKGYTLKGRARIRTLEVENPFYKDIIKRIWNKKSYEIERFTKIIDV